MRSEKKFQKYFSFVGGALMVGGMLIGATSLSAETLEGTVSDAMCGADHGGKPADKCTMGCVKKGSDFALVVGSKVYTLKGKTEGLDKLAGAKASVTGKVDGTTVTVESVAAGK